MKGNFIELANIRSEIDNVLSSQTMNTESTGQHAITQSRWTQPVLISVLLTGLAIAAYWPVVYCDFVNLDDIEYVVQNLDLRSGFTSSTWVSWWTRRVCYNWHPLTMISYWIDSRIWGLDALGFHVTNLAFHVVNVLLLFIVLWRMTSNIHRSACVAALFAVHPLHVESVAWIAERKDVLSTFFLLLTLGAYTEYARRPTVLRYLPVFLLMMLGLMAKPMLVTLPVLLILLDLWPLERWNSLKPPNLVSRFPQRTWVQLWQEKLPLFALSLINALITISFQDPTRNAVRDVGIGLRIPHMFTAYLWYLQKTFLPINLIAFYPHPQTQIVWSSVAVGLVTVIVVTLISLWCFRTRPFLLVGWAWFVISLTPVIGIIQVGSQAYADRYAYIPHIGLFVAVVWMMSDWAAQSRTARFVSQIAFTLTMAACVVLTNMQVRYWKTSETLWTHAIEVEPDNGVAQICLGGILVTNGKYETAIEHLKRGIELTYHNAPTAYCAWGRALIELNREPEAEQKLDECLKLDPYNEIALGELSKLLIKQNRHSEAAAVSDQYDKALMQQNGANAEDYRVQVSLGLRKIREGKVQEAKQHFEKACELAPYSAAAFNNLANAQLNLGDLIQARKNFTKALELNPNLAEAHYNLAAILEHEREFDGARKHYAEAYRLNPKDLEAKQKAEQLSKSQ